jgi:hypothetical protein
MKVFLVFMVIILFAYIFFNYIYDDGFDSNDENQEHSPID